MNDVASNRNLLIIDGILSSDFNLYISGDGTYSSPEKNIEEVTIPGRNGTLIFEEGEDGQTYSNIEVTYRAFIFPNFEENFKRLRGFLLSRQGCFRIEDTYHPDEYRLGYFKGALEPTMHQTLYTGEFDITFNCKPQRFLKSGDKEYTFTAISSTINNETYFNAKPLIRAYGNGTISVGGRSVQIVTSSQYTDIDCETMNAYKGGVNCNSNIRLLTGNKFPVLHPGENAITRSGVTQIILTPRWWIL